MKSSWVKKSLGEVCELIADGDWIESKDQSSSGIRLIQTGNVGVGVFRNKDGCEHFISQGTFNRLKCTEIFGGDILISRLPDPVGRACVVPDLGQRLITAVDCSIVRLKQGECLPDFFVYYASSKEWFNAIEAKCTGSTRKRISRKNLTGILVPVPPLPEQKRIVAKIDAAFEKIDKLTANAERNLANAKELFQSALDEAMRPKKGWAERRLGEVGACKNGLNFKRVAVGESIDIVGVGDFKKGLFVDDATSLERLTLDKLPEQDWYLQPNDIVFVRSNGSKALVGRAVIVKTRRLLTFSGFCIRYRIEDKNVNADFLARIVSSERFRKKMLVGRNASTINNVTQPILLAQVIGLPSLVEQKQIVKRLDSLSEKVKSLEQHYTRQVADCTELRQSVLREAFEGRLKKE